MTACCTMFLATILVGGASDFSATEELTTYNVDFKIVGGTDDPAFSVLCVGGSFEVSFNQSNPDTEYSISASGELLPTNRDGRFLVHFDSQVHVNKPSEGSDASATAQGSLYLKLKQEVAILKLLDRKMVIRITEFEP